MSDEGPDFPFNGGWSVTATGDGEIMLSVGGVTVLLTGEGARKIAGCLEAAAQDVWSDD